MKKYIKITLSFAISILSFVFIFELVPLKLLWEKISNTSYSLAALGTIAFLISGPINAYRWKLILASSNFKASSILGLYKIIMMSLLINNITPARLGEVSKGYFLITNENTNLSTAFTTVFLERFLDLIAVLMLFLISFSFLDFSTTINKSFPYIVDSLTKVINNNFNVSTKTLAELKNINIASFIETPIYFATAFIAITITLILIFKKQKQKLILILKKILFFISDHKFSKIENFFENTKFFHNNSNIHLIFLSTIAVWSCYILSASFFFQAFGVNIPLIFMPFVIAMSAIGISIPAAPGGLGPFELAMSLAAILSIGTNWENNLIDIVSCAFTLHLAHLLSASIIGLYFLIKENFSFFKRENLKKEKMQTKKE